MELDGADGPDLDQLQALALTNYGHFTSMLVEYGQVRGLSLHLERLSRDCATLFNVELDLDHVRKCIRHALDPSTDRTVVRVTIFDPEIGLGTIGREATPRVLVTSRNASSTEPSPLRLSACAYQRDLPATKHVGLFGPMQKRREAQRDGFDDVLFVDPSGNVSEIATSNIGFVRQGRIVWPRAAMLAGITMTLLRQALDEAVDTEPVTLADLRSMDAAFATNAAVGVRPVTAVDDITWQSSEHPLLSTLRELYEDVPGESI
ncbi:aminotransferase class IV family protein [Pseudonocardia dioxanivorans]|uniref:aminotransferase class IV family protein n=1 Tax=Pseudonocardia dioxanivorans TaxID=240495 RepID=UPI000CD01771|nr:aminotransferase class IV family protein [Pseudonocardia dioxanivorans]